MKESKYHIEQQDVIFYDNFLDEQTVRKANEITISSGLSFVNGYLDFGGITAYKLTYPNLKEITITSKVNLKVYFYSTTGTKYILDYGSGGSGYIGYTGGNLVISAGVLYVDGEVKASGSFAPAIDTWYDIAVTGITILSPLYGIAVGAYGDTESMAGRVDLFEVYNRMLSLEEIQNLSSV